MEFGQRLREARRAAEISLRTLAGRAGISAGYLSHVERGYHGSRAQGPPGYRTYRQLVGVLALAPKDEAILYQAWRAGASDGEKQMADLLRIPAGHADGHSRESGESAVTHIPILRTVPTGDLAMDVQQYPSKGFLAVTADVRNRHPQCFGYKIEDDGMAPQINRGDRVIAAPGAVCAASGHPCVVAYQAHSARCIVCRYVYDANDGITLVAESHGVALVNVSAADLFWAHPVVVIQHYLL